MLELHRERIVEQIAPPWRLKEQPCRGWNQRTVDIRPGVVDLARAQARDQRTQIKLHEGQDQQSHAGDLQPRSCNRRRPVRQSPQRPDDACENQKRQHQMGGETILRNFHALRKPGGHHPPADDALQRAEAEDQREPPPQFPTQNATPEKPEKRQQISNADHAPEQPVAPFPPENRLEFGKTHAGVEFTILRNGLVGVERLRPLLFTQGRQSSADRFPLDDRKPGFGETRGAADQHHDRDQRCDPEQPPSDSADL